MNRLVFILPLILVLLVSGTAEAKKKKYPNGDYYEGEWKKGQPHGTGKMIYANGNVYEGNWNFGQKENGKMIYANGDIFEGKWDIGMPRNGKMIYANGNIYEGEYYAGTIKYGKMIYRNGNIFAGWWSNGKPKTGTFTTDDGDSYTGTWSGDTIKGSVQSDNLLIDYKGIFQKDNSLRAKVEYKNSSTKTTIAQYVGELKSMKRNGYGELTIYENNVIVSGKWENDNPESGNGSLTCNGMKIPLNIIHNNDEQYMVTLGYPVKSKNIMSLSFSQLNTIPVKLVTPQMRTSVNQAKQEELARKRQAEKQKKEQAEKQRQAVIAQKANSFQISSYIWSTGDIRNLYNQNEVKFNKNLNGYDVIVTGIVKDFSIGTRTNHLFGISTQVYKIHLTDGIIIWTYDSENVENLVRGERIYALASYDGERTEYGELYLGNPDYGLVIITQSIQSMANELFKPVKNKENINPTLYYEELKLVKRM